MKPEPQWFQWDETPEIGEASQDVEASASPHGGGGPKPWDSPSSSLESAPVYTDPVTGENRARGGVGMNQYLDAPITTTPVVRSELISRLEAVVPRKSIVQLQDIPQLIEIIRNANPEERLCIINVWLPKLKNRSEVFSFGERGGLAILNKWLLDEASTLDTKRRILRLLVRLRVRPPGKMMEDAKMFTSIEALAKPSSNWDKGLLEIAREVLKTYGRKGSWSSTGSGAGIGRKGGKGVKFRVGDSIQDYRLFRINDPPSSINKRKKKKARGVSATKVGGMPMRWHAPRAWSGLKIHKRGTESTELHDQKERESTKLSSNYVLSIIPENPKDAPIEQLSLELPRRVLYEPKRRRTLVSTEEAEKATKIMKLQEAINPDAKDRPIDVEIPPPSIKRSRPGGWGNDSRPPPHRYPKNSRYSGPGSNRPKSRDRYGMGRGSGSPANNSRYNQGGRFTPGPYSGSRGRRGRGAGRSGGRGKGWAGGRRGSWNGNRRPPPAPSSGQGGVKKTYL